MSGARTTSRDVRAARIARVWSSMSELVLAEDRRRTITDELGISFFRAKVLRRLLSGPATMRDLAARLVADKPYLSVTVDDLEQRGLLARTVDPDDRRVRLLTLTDEGMQIARRADEILASPPRGFHDLSDEDVAVLERVLDQLTERAG
jgi:DNA-binding MarR family transcriptional regulator